MSELSTDVQAGTRANFGQRLAAYLIDAVLIWIVSGVIWIVTNQSVASLLSLVIGLAYFVYFEGSPAGQTLGKRALGIRVYDFTHGGPIGYGRAFIRYLGRIASGFVCLLGYLWMLWDKEKQTWHDKIASTVVVPVSDYPIEGATS